jgi:hypothetical protein
MSLREEVAEMAVGRLGMTPSGESWPRRRCREVKCGYPAT